MFVEENNKIFVVEDNQVVASFVKEAYYGSCPHPDCEEHGATKYDIKKNENCKSCGTSMKVEFPKGKTKKQDSEKDSEKKESFVVSAELDEVGEEDEDVDNDGDHDESDEYLEHRREVVEDKKYSDEETSSDDDEESSKESSVVEAADMSEAAVECDRCGKHANCRKQGGEFVCDECAAKTASLNKGIRVSHREQEGTIFSVVPGLYGDTYGVKFDNGTVGEFLEEQLTPVESAAPVYLSSIEEINADYIDYEVVPANTYDELEEKTRLARNLNLRAKSLILDSKISMHERVNLDNIITATAADIRDFKEGQLHLQEIEAEAYLARAPKYKINDEFMGWGSQARTKTDEDISWVNDIDVDFNPIDDTRLISMASDAVSSLSREQLADADFLKEVKYYNSQALPTESHARFASFVDEAAKMRLEEPVQVTAKTASVESFDDIDDAALYM